MFGRYVKSHSGATVSQGCSAKDFPDYCILNDFDVAWSFAFGGLTGRVRSWESHVGKLLSDLWRAKSQQIHALQKELIAIQAVMRDAKHQKRQWLRFIAILLDRLGLSCFAADGARHWIIRPPTGPRWDS